jgi:carbon-monoxide dehydrogenase medium subunit
MKAPDFAYERPGTLADALALLSDPEREAAPLAGGQSLMPMMNFRMARPDMLVDLNGIAELAGIAEDADGLRIGAMTRYAELAASEAVRGAAPLFAKALPHIAHAAIRNRGTIGGSVALADPAAEMPALLLALGAEVELAGPCGSRRVAADDFFTGMYETARAPGELVTAIHVPRARPAPRFAFHELARRHGDYAMAGVAVAAAGHAALSGVRVAFFAVADRALRAPGAEAALEGSDGGARAAAAAAAALDEIDFAGDLNAAPATKRHLAGVVLKRALAEF